MLIEIFTTGGTIDKIYFDAKSDYAIGDPQIVELLRDANLTLEYRVVPLLRKDSLELTENDRRMIRQAVSDSPLERIVITHGTLQEVADKTIVLTGAMQPARFRFTDAIYNVASALTAVQILPPGVYIAMNGQIFDPAKARKNVTLNCFERL